MTEIVIHAARRIPPIDWVGVPDAHVGKVSAVCRTLQECEDLVHWFGNAAFCPYQPVIIHGPGGWTLLIGAGYAPAAELRDLAVTTWNRQALALKANNGNLTNLEELRERYGAAPQKDKMNAIAEAVRERIKRHKANPITDPERKPRYVRVRGRTTFPKPDTQEILNA